MRVCGPGAWELACPREHPLTLRRPTRPASQRGLERLDAAGMLYNPLTKRWALDAHDLDVNYIISFARKAGAHAE